MISVIIPVLNEADNIESFLRHLQPFRESGHELILVDGGSTDNTLSHVAPWVDRVLVSGAGRARQMNAGAAVAKGDLLLFQHVDTLLPDSTVCTLSSLEGKSCWGRFDVCLSPGHWMFPVISGLMNIRSRVTGIATGDQSIFVSRDLFDRVGGFPLQPLMEDVELSTRLKRITSPVCIRNKVRTSSRRWQEKGVWRTIFLMWQFRLAYFLGIPAETLAASYYPGYELKSDIRVREVSFENCPDINTGDALCKVQKEDG